METQTNEVRDRPVVAGDRIYIATAVSRAEQEPELKVGLYGDIGAANAEITSNTWSENPPIFRMSARSCACVV